MTRLTYVFPCASGLSKVAIPALSQYLRLGDDIKSVLWLSLFFSLGFLAICFIYLVLIISISFCSGKNLFDYHLKKFNVDITLHRNVLIAFLNGLLSAVELFLIVLTAGAYPSPSIALILLALTQGQFVTALIIDLAGVWTQRFFLPPLCCLGACFLFLGTIMLLMYPLLNAFFDPWTLGRYFIAFVAGIISCLNYVFTKRLSHAFVSYWAGTSSAALGEAILLAVITVAIDPKGSSLNQAGVLFYQSNQVAMYICAVVSLFLSSAVIQWYAETGGFFSAMGPLYAGQTVLSACLEMANRLPSPEVTATYETATGSTIVALILVIVGSWMMWTSRWTTPYQTVQEIHYAIRKNVVVAIPSPPKSPEGGRPTDHVPISEDGERFAISPKSRFKTALQHRIPFLTHPAAYYDKNGTVSIISATSTPSASPNRSTALFRPSNHRQINHGMNQDDFENLDVIYKHPPLPYIVRTPEPSSPLGTALRQSAIPSTKEQNLFRGNHQLPHEQLEIEEQPDATFGELQSSPLRHKNDDKIHAANHLELMWESPLNGEPYKPYGSVGSVEELLGLRVELQKKP